MGADSQFQYSSSQLPGAANANRCRILEYLLFVADEFERAAVQSQLVLFHRQCCESILTVVQSVLCEESNHLEMKIV